MRLDHITPKQFGKTNCEPKIRKTHKAGDYHIPNSSRRGLLKQQKTSTQKELLDDHRALEPPDPFPNSEVKRRIADGSVGSPHVRVGHRQAPTAKPQISNGLGFFYDQKILDSCLVKSAADNRSVS